MSFITIPDLATHIYPEGMNAISREDDTKMQSAIDAAILQAAQYLGRYDTAIIFALEGAAREPFANLMTYIKDIAKWNFIAIANATVDLDLAERRYTGALKELAMISRTLQAGWPLLEAEVSDKPFRSGSNIKFNHEGF